MAQADQSRDEAFLASETDPQTRNDIARGVLFSCKRITLRKIAKASRDNNASLLKELEAQQETYDAELKAVYKGDKEAIERTLTTHVKFLKAHKQKKKFQSQQTLGHGSQ